MKLFIDALYISESGGLRLLRYLLATLQQKGIAYHLLADHRCDGMFDGDSEYMVATLRSRRAYYKQLKQDDYTSMLCFGNIPPPIRIRIPVYTYFHNINLLTLSEFHSPLSKLKGWLKRQVFRYYKQHTDLWIVQTTNTAQELVTHLKENENRVKLYPFFELPDRLNCVKSEVHGDDYVFISDFTGAKGHDELLAAWRLLAAEGIRKTLHLTINSRHTAFVAQVKAAVADGIPVVDHGIIPFNEVIELYKKSKALIFPSHNESLGLGIIEAITAGCQVISSDLPFVHAVCRPSLTFDPYDAMSIANAVKQFEAGHYRPSELLIGNRINEFVDLICQKGE